MVQCQRTKEIMRGYSASEEKRAKKTEKCRAQHFIDDMPRSRHKISSQRWVQNDLSWLASRQNAVLQQKKNVVSRVSS